MAGGGRVLSSIRVTLCTCDLMGRCICAMALSSLLLESDQDSKAIIKMGTLCFVDSGIFLLDM